MSEVVTELKIDASGAVEGANVFKGSMGSAEEAARKTVGATNDVSLAIAGIGTATIAAIAGISQGLNYVVGLNKGLADLATMAKQAGLSLADMQGIQFGGQIAGLSAEQINAGLAKSAGLLNDASRNANSLSKELAANGLSVKDGNGQLISQNKLLGIAADLVKRAQNPGDAKAIAEMLGFTKEWIPLLEQGSGAMSGLAAEAQKAGAVIDDATIQRATEFDARWRKSSVEFSTQMRAALLGLMPYVDDLLDGVSNFIKSIDKAKAIEAAEKHAKDALQPGADALSEAGFGGLKIEITPQTDAALKDFQDGSKTIWERIQAAAAALQSTVTVISAQDSKWTFGSGASVDDTVSAAKNTNAWNIEAEAAKKLSAEVVVLSNSFGEHSKVVAKDVTEGRNAYETAINTVKRHTDQTAADADAVGLGAGALAQFKAEAQLMSAAEAAGNPITEAMRAKIKDLGDDARDAANDLAKVKVAADIKFNKDTIGFSQEDVQIATQLKNIYPDVATALASVEAQQIRVTNAQKLLADGFREVGKAMFTAFLSGKNVMDAMVQSLDNIAKKLADSAFDNLLTGLMTGNLAQAGLGAAQAGASALISMFTGDQKAKKALQEAQDAWHKMTDQVIGFRQAAAGIDLGPLTSKLQSLFATLTTLVEAAAKAHDWGAVISMQQTFNAGVVRLVTQFENGNQELAPLQQSLKGVNDEASGLKDSLQSMGLLTSDLAAAIDGSLNAQLAQLTANFKATTLASLHSQLNDANGQGFINDFGTLVSQHHQNVSDLASFGQDRTLADQLFVAAAQKLVDQNNLVGTQITNLITQFPELAGAIHDAASATTDATQALADFSNFITNLAQNIQKYLDNLRAGSQSVLSPQDRLSAAQSQFSTQFTLAQGGNQTAANGITDYASNLIDAAKAYFGSGAGAQAIISQVTSQLSALPGQLSGTQQIVNAITAQTTALQLAFATGDATSIANALLPQFNSLTSATSTGLTYSQFSSLANGFATQGTLQNVFGELDGNGNGILEKSELIKANTATTATKTSDTAASSQTVASNIANLQIIQINTSNTIGAVQAVQNAVSQLHSDMVQYMGGLYTVTTQSFGVIDVLVRMRNMMVQQNLGWGNSGHVGTALGTFAGGTDFAPGGMALIGERGPEIMNVPRGAQIIPNHRINFSNDNSAMVAAITRLERIMAIGVRVDGEGHAKTSDAVERVVQETGRKTSRVRARAA